MLQRSSAFIPPQNQGNDALITSVVSHDVEIKLSPRDIVEIEVGRENSFGLSQRSGEDNAER